MERPSSLPSELWPFDSKILHLDGHRLHFVDVGNGPVILMTHAGPAWSFLFRDLIADLRRDFRCVVVDLPGTGLSTSGPGFENTIEENARVFRRFVETLDLRGLTLVLSDLGGPVGLRAASWLPDRVERLVLAGTFGFPLTAYPKAVRMMRFVSGGFFGAINRSFDVIPRAIAGPGTPLRNHSRAEKAAWRTPTGPRARRNRWQRLFRDGAENSALLAGIETSLRTQLNNRPALLLYGEKDPAREMGWQRRFQELLPNHAAVTVKGARHFAIEDAPQEAALAMRRWLAQAGPRPGTRASTPAAGASLTN